MKVEKGDIFLFIFVVIEMIWAVILIYRPTFAAEPEQGVTIVKSESPLVTLYEPVTAEKTIYINVNVAEEIQPELTLSDEDKELIARLVHAEAGGEDMLGKRLIVDVILNRMELKSFPDTVKGVIFEKSQFTKPSKSYTEDDMLAVELELLKRVDHNVVYFRSGHFHKCGVRLYQHGNHYFSGRGTT